LRRPGAFTDAALARAVFAFWLIKFPWRLRIGCVTPVPLGREVELRTPDLAPLTPHGAVASPTIDGSARAQVAIVPISATMLTRNSERLLARALRALQWCEEVVVLDNGSTDRTVEIAAGFANVSLHRLAGPFPGFGPAHRRAVAMAQNNWILSIDSDEVVSPELATEIASLQLDAGAVYQLRFRNFYDGQEIVSSGWSNEIHERMFNRQRANFDQRAVHEHIVGSGLNVVTLRHAVDHYSIHEVADFLRKSAFYGRLWAEQKAGKKAGGAWRALSHGGWAFLRSFILERGCLQGEAGLAISAYNAQTAFWKYLMLREANDRQRGR
jgi:glycosyltransferase involved in cell wall biosynthesis